MRGSKLWRATLATLAAGSLLLSAHTSGYAAGDGYESLGGQIISTPVTVSWGSGRLDTFVVGTDHHLYHKYYDNGSGWGPSISTFEPLGGCVLGRPAVASWGPNRLDIFVTGCDHHLYHKYYDGTGFYPENDYEPLGGYFQSDPVVVSWGPGRLDIFGTGGDGHLYHKAFDPATGWYPPSTGDYEPLGGCVFGRPAAASWGPGRLDIFVTGCDHHLYHKYFDGTDFYPRNDFEPLGGYFQSDPTVVSWGPGRLDIFGTGGDGGLYHKAFDATTGWYPEVTGDFEPLGGCVLGRPAVASWGPNRLDIFVTGCDHHLYHKYSNGIGFYPRNDYEYLGGYLPSEPSVVSWGSGRLDILVQGGDGHLYCKWFDRIWGPAPNLTFTPWAIILCRFADQPQTPRPPSFFQQLFTEAGSGKGGLFDYWHDQSYGAVSLAGSQVFGWYDEPQTLADDQKVSRFQRIQNCINTATRDVDFPAYYGVVVILNTVVDSGSVGQQKLTFNGMTKTYGLVVLDPAAWYVSFAAHEMGHGYGLDHSYDTAMQQCSSGGGPGEYCDPWDIMSADVGLKSFNNPYANFGESGPGLNAFNLDKLGWIPASRVYQGSSGQITLTALSHPEAGGYLIAKVPVAGNDPFGLPSAPSYYTVEFRHQDGWDQGIPQDVVLIHAIGKDGVDYLVDTNGGPQWLQGQTYHDTRNNVAITVVSIDPASKTATIIIGPN